MIGGSTPPPLPLFVVKQIKGKIEQKLTELLVVVLGGSAPPPLPLAIAAGVNKNTAAEHKMQAIVW